MVYDVDVIVCGVLQEVVHNMLHEDGVILQFVYDCLNLKKERKYMCEEKWTFSIKQKRVCLKRKLIIKAKGSLLKRKKKINKEIWRSLLGEESREI